jgi:hypothetical protein
MAIVPHENADVTTDVELSDEALTLVSGGGSLEGLGVGGNGGNGGAGGNGGNGGLVTW